MIHLLYLALLVVLFLTYLYRLRKRLRIMRWKNSLNLQEHERIFQHIYQHTNGFLLSQQARKIQDAFDYVYGEIEFISFLALLSLTKPDENTVFYDLGCGVGKAVLACAMVYPIRYSIGVEILPELYFNACERAKQLTAVKNYHHLHKRIKFALGDFLSLNFDDATLIFINATALFNPTWETLCKRLDQLPHLNTILTTSKPLISKQFEVIFNTQVAMSWGVVTAYVHARKKNDLRLL